MQRGSGFENSFFQHLYIYIIKLLFKMEFPSVLKEVHD
jgi:hypothetical protein